MNMFILLRVTGMERFYRSINHIVGFGQKSARGARETTIPTIQRGPNFRSESPESVDGRTLLSFSLFFVLSNCAGPALNRGEKRQNDPNSSHLTTFYPRREHGVTRNPGGVKETGELEPRLHAAARGSRAAAASLALIKLELNTWMASSQVLGSELEYFPPSGYFATPIDVFKKLFPGGCRWTPSASISPKRYFVLPPQLLS